MQTLDLVQGSPEWKEARSKYFTASEAPAMMGCNPKVSRNELLRMKATGDVQEFSRWVEEVLFERGHEVEAKTRPMIEDVLGDELYPMTVTDDDNKLLASLDGITMDDSVVWECKQWNAEKYAHVMEGRIPPIDFWQVVQQLVITGAQKAVYTVSDGEEFESATYSLKQEDKKKLLAGWAQFSLDLAEFTYEPIKAEPEGRAPDQLPSLNIQVKGEVTESNLAEFKEHALAVFHGINKDLQTDEDFASADKTVKWCQGVEQKLETAKEQALSQTASIDMVFKTIDAVKEEARKVRLELDKLVKQRKKDIRAEILRSAQIEYGEHCFKLSGNLDIKFNMVPMPEEPDFAGAMKNKRTVKSLKDAVDQVLADSKIKVNDWYADLVRKIAVFTKKTEGYEFLFSDSVSVVSKDLEDMVNVIDLRIRDHKEAEEKRMAEEREKIRQEEEQKAQQKVEAEKVSVSVDQGKVTHVAKHSEVEPVTEIRKVLGQAVDKSEIEKEKRIEIIQKLSDLCKNQGQAMKIFNALAAGEIPHVTINY